MEALSFVPQYTKWHYTRGIREYIHNWMNVLWFIVQFFSFAVLIKTLLSPWERMSERYRGGLNLEAIASTFIINILMRGLGFVIRVIVLLVGFAFLVLSMIVGLLLGIAWLLFPLILFFLFALSFQYLF